MIACCRCGLAGSCASADHLYGAAAIQTTRQGFDPQHWLGMRHFGFAALFAFAG
jgi:hypothetical protein